MQTLRQMKKLAPFIALFCLALAPVHACAQGADKDVFAVVVTRHGVRSISTTPAQYSWADWQPVAPGFLSARGYSLMTYMGQFYRVYFAAHGIPISCGTPNVFVYADTDQRTLLTGEALIAGMCGKAAAIPMLHDADAPGGKSDPLFDAAPWAASQHRIRPAASRAAVMAALPSPPSQLVAQHRAEFDALQRLLDARCAGTCAPVISGASAVIATKEELSELDGPVKTASTYAEDLFLESAQCRPDAPADVSAAMRLHVLAYAINARTAYNARVRGGTLFAHIVAMLQAKAGQSHGNVSIPDISRDNVAIFSGHDTELGALGGILDAHWPLASGMVPDDMPPGGALMFELYKSPAGGYRVRLRFAYETMEQYRHYKLVPGGVTSVPVRFEGCSGTDCSVPLERLSALARAISSEGLVRDAWTRDSDAPVTLDPLANPKWTRCKL